MRKEFKNKLLIIFILLILSPIVILKNATSLASNNEKYYSETRTQIPQDLITERFNNLASLNLTAIKQIRLQARYTGRKQLYRFILECA